MAKHSRRRRTPSLVLAGATTAGLSAALVFGHATNTTVDTSQIQLAAAVIGVGGRGDPTAARIEQKLNNLDVPAVPHPYTYVPVHYPASFFIDASVAAGIPVLLARIDENDDPDVETDRIVVVAYSEGTIVAEEVRRDLDSNEVSPDELSFVMIASPNVPNGGIFARFPNLNLFIVSSNGPAEPTAYDTVYVTNEYDPYADFPAYLNPFSLANTLAALAYVHPDQYYDDIDLTAPNVIKREVYNEETGSTDTYYFVKAEHLPLLQLPRDIAAAAGLTPFTEPLFGLVEPVLKVLVDMGYTDRENLNPEKPTQFSLITPPAKIGEAIGKIPGALAEGLQNFTEGFTPATTPANTPFSTAWSSADERSATADSVPEAPQQRSIVDNPVKPPTGAVSQTSPPTNGSSNPSSNPSSNLSSDPLQATPSNPSAAPSSDPPSLPSTPSPAASEPKPGAFGQLSPFTLGKKGAQTNDPDDTATTNTQPGGRLANTVSGAFTGVLGENPKPKPKPSTTDADAKTDAAAQGQSQSAA